MARGMVVGEAISTLSQSVGPEYGDRFDATFGSRDESRGRWVWSAKEGKLVRPWEREDAPEVLARDAAVITGRIHEGVVAPDGSDIGTRARRRAWMREHDVVDYDDCKTLRAKKRARDEAVRTGTTKPDLKLRDEIAKKLYDAKLHR